MSYEEEDTCALCIARARFGGKVEGDGVQGLGFKV
jgi:hypothetical protein